MKFNIVVDCMVCHSSLENTSLQTEVGDTAAFYLEVPLCTHCQRRITDVAYEEGYQDGLNSGEWS